MSFPVIHKACRPPNKMSPLVTPEPYWYNQKIPETMPAATALSSFSTVPVFMDSPASEKQCSDYSSNTRPAMEPEERSCKFSLFGDEETFDREECLDVSDQLGIPNMEKVEDPEAPDESDQGESTHFQFEDPRLERKPEEDTFGRFRSKSEGAVNRRRQAALKGALKKNTQTDEKLKRRVSFADANGFQLEQIKSYDIQQPSDDDDDLYLLPSPGRTTDDRRAAAPRRGFVPYFTLPWSGPGKQKAIYAALEDRKICLEAFTITSWRITGTVLVKNLSFHKRVFVRQTTDKWQSYQDVEAAYLIGVNPVVDRFRFDLQFPFKMSAGAQLELAFGYEAPERAVQCWDSNCGNNYVFWYNDKI